MYSVRRYEAIEKVRSEETTPGPLARPPQVDDQR
jgi:hypothetical protein